MEENFGATKFGEIVTDQKFAKFSQSKFLHAMVKSHMSVVISILQYFKHVPVKLECMTHEQDEQLPEPNGCLRKSVPTKAIELTNVEVLILM